jgi:DNA-binding NarL/FixJ family response regulator
MRKGPDRNEISVIIADDHKLFLDGLQLLLSHDNRIRIVGKAHNGRELVRSVNELHPDVVITDIQMPVLNGIEACKIIRKEHPSIAMISLSMLNTVETILELLNLGVRGVLSKSSDPNEIINSILAVSHNDIYYCKMTQAKLSELYTKKGYAIEPGRDNSPLFTVKEIQIIQMICQEFSAKEIGDILHHSSRTIEGYKAKILEKIHAKTSAGIVLFAVKNGIFPR